MCDEGLDSIGLTHDRNKWQAVVHRTKHLHWALTVQLCILNDIYRRICFVMKPVFTVR
jgi:hypothetical protein